MSATLGFGYCMPDLPEQFWPDQQVGQTAVYGFDATATITNQSDGTVDPIIGASIMTKPSGSGELTPESITVSSVNGVWMVNVKLQDGYPSRDYIHQLTLYLNSTQVIPILIGQVCDPVLFVPPQQPAPSPDFCAPVTWGTVP